MHHLTVCITAKRFYSNWNIFSRTEWRRLSPVSQISYSFKGRRGGAVDPRQVYKLSLSMFNLQTLTKTLNFTPTNNLQSLINPICLSLDCGRKTEHSEWTSHRKSWTGLPVWIWGIFVVRWNNSSVILPQVLHSICKFFYISIEYKPCVPKQI